MLCQLAHIENWPVETLGGPRASLNSLMTGPLPASERSTMTIPTSYLDSVVRVMDTNTGPTTRRYGAARRSSKRPATACARKELLKTGRAHEARTGHEVSVRVPHMRVASQ